MSEDIYKRIGLRLKKTRISAGYKTAASFADTIDVNQPTYSNHENGNKAISIETIMFYAKHLGISWKRLIAGDNLDDDQEEKLERCENISDTKPLLDAELLCKILTAVNELIFEKRLSIKEKDMADILSEVYNSIYERSMENSRFNIKDIKMCAVGIIKLVLEKKK